MTQQRREYQEAMRAWERAIDATDAARDAVALAEKVELRAKKKVQRLAKRFRPEVVTTSVAKFNRYARTPESGN